MKRSYSDLFDSRGHSGGPGLFFLCRLLVILFLDDKYLFRITLLTILQPSAWRNMSNENGFAPRSISPSSAPGAAKCCRDGIFSIMFGNDHSRSSSLLAGISSAIRNGFGDARRTI